MARTNGVMSKPAGTTAVPGEKVASQPYNTVIDDLYADANNPRPILAGGTGASTASAARTNLGAVSKTGDTMTGDLTISNGTGTTVLGTGGNMQINGDGWSQIVRSNGGTYNLNISGNASSSGNADTLDGQHGAYYADIPARLGFSPAGAFNECQHNSGTVEFGYVSEGYDSVIDLPNPYVLTGLRTQSSVGGIWVRGKTIRNQ